MSGPLPHATRRTALALGVSGAAIVGLTAVTGCDAARQPSPAVGTASPADDSAAGTSGEPDEALVEDALAELAAATALVAAVGARFRRLRGTMAAFERLHEAHVEALGGSPETGSGGATVPADPAAALATVRRSEKRLQDRLVESAAVADSGPLARLLASMSAAVAQRLATSAETAA